MNQAMGYGAMESYFYDLAFDKSSQQRIKDSCEIRQYEIVCLRTTMKTLGIEFYPLQSYDNIEAK